MSIKCGDKIVAVVSELGLYEEGEVFVVREEIDMLYIRLSGGDKYYIHPEDQDFDTFEEKNKNMNSVIEIAQTIPGYAKKGELYILHRPKDDAEAHPYVIIGGRKFDVVWNDECFISSYIVLPEEMPRSLLMIKYAMMYSVYQGRMGDQNDELYHSIAGIRLRNWFIIKGIVDEYGYVTKHGENWIRAILNVPLPKVNPAQVTPDWEIHCGKVFMHNSKPYTVATLPHVVLRDENEEVVSEMNPNNEGYIELNKIASCKRHVTQEWVLLDVDGEVVKNIVVKDGYLVAFTDANHRV